MSFHRTMLGVCTAVFATVFASAAFAQCCGGVAVAPVVAPVAVVQEVIQPVMAVQPVIPAVPVVAAPIAVDNWDTNGWGCGGGCGCGGCGGFRGCGGCGGFVGGHRRRRSRRLSVYRRPALRLPPALWVWPALRLRPALRLWPLARLIRFS